MGASVSLIRSVLHKDVRLLWPFAGLTALLYASAQVPPLVQLMGPVAGLAQMAMQFAFVLLILVVCYEDAVVSLRHDWLTRPLPGPTLLAAKVLFVCLAIAVPSMLGAFIYQLTEGRSVGEALVVSFYAGANGSMLLGFAIVMAFASVTGGIRQAFIVFLACIALLALGTVVFNRVFEDADPLGATPAAWLMVRTHQILFTLASVGVLWVQYRYRHTRAARAIAGVAVLAGAGLLATVNWSRASALQRALAPEGDAPEASATFSLPAGCFPVRRFDRRIDIPTNEKLDVEARREENLRPLTFRTRLEGLADTSERRIVVDYATISWYRAGERQGHLPLSLLADRTLAAAASPGAERRWILSFDEFQRLSAIDGIEAHVDYSLSVLSPTTRVELVANGERRHHAGLGWCDATVDRGAGSVEVRCYTPGAQPARIIANVVGADEEAAVTSNPRMNYTPAALDFWGGQAHRMTLKYGGPDVPRVTVTAYEPRAHFDRTFVVPGVLGGSASACPAP